MAAGTEKKVPDCKQQEPLGMSRQLETDGVSSLAFALERVTFNRSHYARSRFL